MHGEGRGATQFEPERGATHPNLSVSEGRRNPNLSVSGARPSQFTIHNSQFTLHHSRISPLHRIFLLLALLLAFALRLHRLGAESLWYDETVSVHLARLPVAAMLAHTAGDIHPPGYYLLLHGWQWLTPAVPRPRVGVPLCLAQPLVRHGHRGADLRAGAAAAWCTGSAAGRALRRARPVPDLVQPGSAHVHPRRRARPALPLGHNPGVQQTAALALAGGLRPGRRRRPLHPLLLCLSPHRAQRRRALFVGARGEGRGARRGARRPTSQFTI
jgi:hypothetical protein